MRIALLTYFAADNYGATLQAYATIKAFEREGHKVELVNYVIPEPENPLFKKILLLPKYLKFNSFRKKYFKNITKKYNNLEDLRNDPPRADCYLVGSDQTWNPEISKHMAKGFFLDFGSKDIFKVTYATSFGKEKWEDTEWINSKETKELLNQFDLISIRETSGLNILNDYFSIKNVTNVIDPVLLFENYNDLTGNVKENNKIIAYKLINSEAFYNICRKTGKYFSTRVQSIGSIRKIDGIDCNYPESPTEWIKCIAGAKYVITDSFHGAVFSILYRRQFVICASDPKRITRIKSLLDILGIEGRILTENDDAEKYYKLLSTPIDYDTVHLKLKRLREESINYIKQINIEYKKRIQNK